MEIETSHVPKPLDIFKNITTVHGVNHLTGARGAGIAGGAGRGGRRAAWALVLAGNLLFTAYLILVIKWRYESNQIYTRIDATCRVNQVPFPAVSICNANIISMKQTQNIENILKFYGRKEDEIQAFFDSLQELVLFDFGSQLVANFTDIMGILKRHYFTVDSLMEELRQPCERLLMHCEFNRKSKPCRDVFKMIKTLEGHCCAFNYAALNDAVDEPLWEGEPDLEYYDDRKVGVIISTSKSGRGSGLTVLLNIEPQDYPPWSKATFYGIKTIISDPNDFPETTVVSRRAAAGEALDVKVEPMVFLSEPGVRRVPVPVRDCWFHDEILLEHTDRYSYETCNTECKMRAYSQQCRCIPYRYPREQSTRICELSDVPCLHNMTARGLVPCVCHFECSDKKYNVRSNRLPLSEQEFAPNLTKNMDISTLISLKVYFGESTCNCYKKTLVIDYDRLIGTYAGVVSLSVGGSLLTLAELLQLGGARLLALLGRAQWTTKWLREHF